MDEAFLIYLYLVGGKIIFVLIFGSVVITILSLVLWLVTGESSSFGKDERDGQPDKDSLNYFKAFGWLKKSTKALAIILIASSFYPSKDELKWIIGGALVWNGVEAASDIEGINKLPDNTVKAMNSFLESISTEDVEAEK